MDDSSRIPASFADVLPACTSPSFGGPTTASPPSLASAICEWCRLARVGELLQVLAERFHAAAGVVAIRKPASRPGMGVGLYVLVSVKAARIEPHHGERRDRSWVVAGGNCFAGGLMRDRRLLVFFEER